MGTCGCGGIGSRNRRIAIERPSTTPDAAGHVDLADDANWDEVGKCWSAMTTRGGREARVFDQVQADVSHIIEMPYNSLTKTIVPKWRLKMGTRRFNITAAYDVDEQHRTIRIEATEAK